MQKGQRLIKKGQRLIKIRKSQTKEIITKLLNEACSKNPKSSYSGRTQFIPFSTTTQQLYQSTNYIYHPILSLINYLTPNPNINCGLIPNLAQRQFIYLSLSLHFCYPMDPSPQLKTPTKSKPIPTSEDIRLILSDQKPKPFGLFQQFNHDTFANNPLFVTNQKDPHEEHSYFSITYLQPNSYEYDSPQQSSHSPQFQTVKKQFELRFPQKHHNHPTTARQNHKGCNCDKSKCQKNYCICYKMGNTCSEDCECIGCQNHVITMEHLKNERIALEMKSNSKQKGCNCKNSNCLKNYCICHQNGNKCSEICKCENCHNMDHEEKQDREEEMSRLRLMFTGRKRVKISEFEYGENNENLRMNE